MNQIKLYISGILISIWGIAHFFPTKNVIAMEWTNEGAITTFERNRFAVALVTSYLIT